MASHGFKLITFYTRMLHICRWWRSWEASRQWFTCALVHHHYQSYFNRPNRKKKQINCSEELESKGIYLWLCATCGKNNFPAPPCWREADCVRCAGLIIKHLCENPVPPFQCGGVLPKTWKTLNHCLTDPLHTPTGDSPSRWKVKHAHRHVTNLTVEELNCSGRNRPDDKQLLAA